MLKQGSIMVFWSYLLVNAPAATLLENVLAPLDPETAAAAAASSNKGATSVASRDEAVSRPLVEPSADELDLLSELEQQLAAKLQPAGTLRLIPLSPLPRLTNRPALPEVELIDHPARLTSSSALLRFQLLDGDRALGTYAVTFRVQVLAQVWTPSRRLEVGEALLASDVTTREVDLVRDPKAVPADPSVLGRYEVARAAAPERPLTWNDITPRALVRKGQLVEVVASEGMLTLTMKGQATRSGSLGDVVTIRNLESKREFPAEVIDENKVRVHF